MGRYTNIMSTHIRAKRLHWCVECDQEMKLQKCRDLAESFGGKCLSEKFVPGRAYLQWQCSLGHTWNASWLLVGGKTKKGAKWCPQCAKIAKRDALIVEKNSASLEVVDR